MTALAVVVLAGFFIIFLIGIGIFEDSKGFEYFSLKEKIKEENKFIEISFDNFLILKEVLNNNKNKYFVFKKEKLPVLEIIEDYDKINYRWLKGKSIVILFLTLKDYFKYFHWLKKYLKEKDKKDRQETIKNNFAEDTVKDLIKDLENFAEQEKKESADKFEQAKNTFNEVNKK